MSRIILLLIFFAAWPVMGQQKTEKILNEAELNQRLDEIQNQLTALKNQLNQAEGKEAKLLTELENQDLAINELGKEIHQNKQQVANAKDQIEALSLQIKKKNDSIGSQKEQMAELLRLHIYINHDRILKMLLLKSSTQTAEITQHQLNYLQDKLYRLIENIAVQISQLQVIKSQLSKEQEQLKVKQQTLISSQQHMQEQKSQRRLVLNNLRETIAQYQTESEGLTKDEKRLNQLLVEISQLLTDLPDDLGSNTTFKRLKGKLNRPLDGNVIRSYRSLRAGNSRWDGIVIGNEAGQTVKTPAYGRVAFADWLRGYGLLIVIDHGDEYMTLYGHNESVLVEPGDWVQPDDAIATVGNSGNINPSGVYFEIRKAADPTNPIPWFK
ncbi:murein hydrolase activator EnvC family protein [Marinicella rhabdoformis]|uniref:murein hydrolase activator EnvC family protein n=1 Tax=Marinicella rhabdoformis TaxID=2580566 RepID=UPI0012AED748|nr:peptidoglycan DD-metalloendopeptidase family protein [Marinicella rhabdoformis]